MSYIVQHVTSRLWSQTLRYSIAQRGSYCKIRSLAGIILTEYVSCRLQDSQDQSLPLFKTDISPPPSPYALSHADTLPTRDIVPQRSPSNYPAASPNSTTQSSTADLRPSTTDPTRKSRRGSAPRKNSEAARYLAQFGSLDTTRPTYSRSSTMNGEPIPSLSHTPNSLASATSPYTLQQYSASSSSQRTLPQRQPNPRWSSTSFSSRSVGLVTPISHASSFVTITGEQSTKIEGIAHHDFAHSYSYSYKSDLAGPLSYEKKSSFEGSMSPRRGSLKQLFRFEEMRSQPIEGQQTEPESYFP